MTKRWKYNCGVEFFNSNPVMAYMYLCVKVTKALFNYSGLITLIFHLATISWDMTGWKQLSSQQSQICLKITKRQIVLPIQTIYLGFRASKYLRIYYEIFKIIKNLKINPPFLFGLGFFNRFTIDRCIDC